MEGIARYVHIRSAEAAEHYQPSPEYAAPPDYLSFETYAREARSDTLSELKKADLATWKRTLVYSFGASEGLLLDRLRPNGALDPYFESSLREYAKINPGGNGQVGVGYTSRFFCRLAPADRHVEAPRVAEPGPARSYLK